jgi:large subunit ribosomal protein L7/L12
MNIKIAKIIEELKLLTLLECVSLIKEIEKTFDINVSSSVPVANSLVSEMSEKNAQNLVDVTEVEEKSSFNIILLEVPADKKIAVLKLVRNLTGLGLKESKEIVDNVPKQIKEAVSKEESENIKKELEALGAKVDIK